MTKPKMSDVERDALYSLACPWHTAPRGVACGRDDEGPFVCEVRITANQRKQASAVFAATPAAPRSW